MGTINRTTSDLNNRTRSALYLTQAESITGDNTYRSPGTYVAEIDTDFTENINYTSGSAVYTGTDPIQIRLISNISISSASAGVSVSVTGGVNSTPDASQEKTHTLTSANDEKELTCISIHKWTNGDTLDFYVKASADVILEKATWDISRYDR